MRLSTVFWIFLLCVSGLDAQVKQSYTFEGDEKSWSASDSLLWSRADKDAGTGSESLSYTIEEGSISPDFGVVSIDTEHTIQKVRTAITTEEEYIVASDYNGVLMLMSFDGSILWKDKTGIGTMNHDIWCYDLNGDGSQEILVANANGSLYCYNILGSRLWEFRPFESVHLTPMFAVCVVKDENLQPYIVCGDFTCNIYYLRPDGSLEKTIHSTKYSRIKGWGDNAPEEFHSNANFLRPIPQKDGSDLLLVNTSNNHMQGSGDVVIMKPLSESAHLYIEDPKGGKSLGDMRVFDNDGDGHYEVVYGSSTLNSHKLNRMTFNEDYSSADIVVHTISNKVTGNVSYRVNQIFHLPGTNDNQYTVLSSNQLLTYDVDTSFILSERLSGVFTYNDIWNAGNGRMVIASSQDGGSCIHILDPSKAGWKSEFENLVPIGNIATMKSYRRKYKELVETYTKPSWQREPRKVIGFERPNIPILSELGGGSQRLALYENPFTSMRQDPSWRSPLYDGNIFQDKRDGRMKYEYTADEIYDHFMREINEAEGFTAWGGHGNDPLGYSLELLKKVADSAKISYNKNTIYIFPEMNSHGGDFDFVLDNHFYPLMESLQNVNGKVALRSKNIYWQGPIYTSSFDRIVSGEFADVVIPVMEETTDKTQDLSVMGRMGFWASGCVDGWGVRCSRDDPSFIRSRQFSSQKLANHILRKTIYSIASGATYIHNAYMDGESPSLEHHISLALELIEKEVLFVPERNEILSISPVHLSIYNPSEEYIEEAENHKWIAHFDREEEENNPKVFSHMKGLWLGAALTPWDFSTYASGVVDRRQNAIPPYPYGQVLFTPVQNGPLANEDAPRGKLVDKLHPIYQDIMKEYITDGIDYISADGTERFKADTYYTQVKKDIEEGSKKLPLTVSGDKVAWVVAQMSPTHLRLTLVDGGYLDPKERHVTVQFNTITPLSLTDVLDGKSFPVVDGKSSVDVPCGMFRFLDIELAEPFQ